MSSPGSPLKPTGMAVLWVSSAPEAGQVYGCCLPIQHTDLLPPLPCNILCLPGAGESFAIAVTSCASTASTPWSQLSISQGSVRGKPFPAQHGGTFGRDLLLQQGKQGMLQEIRSPLHCLKTAASVQEQSGVPHLWGEGKDAKGQSSSQEHRQHLNPETRLVAPSYRALQGSPQSPQAPAGPALCAVPHDSNVR